MTRLAEADIKPARRQRAPRLSSEARRAQLLECAIRVFAREGIGHANHTQIASEARISLPAVFTYFPTHDSLTRAVVAYVSEFMLDRLIKPAQTGGAKPADEIEATLIGFLDLISTDPDVVRIWLDWSTAVREETWPLYQQHHRKVCAVFEQTIARAEEAGEATPGINREDAAWVLVGLGHMIAQMRFAGLARSRITRTVKSMILAYFPER